jgi:hypothetical protein
MSAEELDALLNELGPPRTVHRSREAAVQDVIATFAHLGIVGSEEAIRSIFDLLHREGVPSSLWSEEAVVDVAEVEEDVATVEEDEPAIFSFAKGEEWIFARAAASIRKLLENEGRRDNDDLEALTTFLHALKALPRPTEDLHARVAGKSNVCDVVRTISLEGDTFRLNSCEVDDGVCGMDVSSRDVAEIGIGFRGGLVDHAEAEEWFSSFDEMEWFEVELEWIATFKPVWL